MHGTTEPPTPPPELPKTRDEWRFHELTTACEWIEEYRLGGYHPVEFGDTFRNGQYKILRKLGYGAHSTVWLAENTLGSHDQLTPGNKYIALKLMRATAPGREIEILTLLKEKSGGAESVVTLFDHFNHIGPNGTHPCLVMEPLGPSVTDFIDAIYQKQQGGSRASLRYTKQAIREITRQALSGLASIHEAGIVHGDIYSGNMMLALPGLQELSKEALLANLVGEVRSEPVRRLDGLRDKWAPSYLAFAQPLWQFVDRDAVSAGAITLKLTDFGGAFHKGDLTADPDTPLPMRAPERIYKSPTTLLDEKIDIWALACVVVNLITRCYPLILLEGWGATKEQLDDEHLLQFHEVLGPLPAYITSRWPTYGTYFDTITRKQLRNTVPTGREVEWTLAYPTLEELLLQNKGDDMSEEDVAEVSSMLRLMLKYDPQERAGAAELLRHDWLSKK